MIRFSLLPGVDTALICNGFVEFAIIAGHDLILASRRMKRWTRPGRIFLLRNARTPHPRESSGIFDTAQLISPDALFDDMLAGTTRFGVQEVGFIGPQPNNKEPGPAEVCRVPQVPNRIDFRVTHFRPTHVSQMILTRGQHFAPLTNERHVVVTVMSRRISALLRIDKRV